MTPRLSLHRGEQEKEPCQHSLDLAAESYRLGDSERAMVVHLVLKLGLPLTPVLQRWAELDHQAREAA